MNHPMILSRQELDEAARAPSYRSEAFAEDLGLASQADDEVPASRRRFAAIAGLLLAAPLGLALVGAVLALLGHGA